jgi:pimeloyl-ACP methyl ester carboxylesterase
MSNINTSVIRPPDLAQIGKRIDASLLNESSKCIVPKKDETIMMLHGTASNSSQWSLLAKKLSQFCQVLTPDIPGYDSCKLVLHQNKSSLDSRINPLLNLLDTVNGKIHLIGHSFGGLVALRLGELRPYKVSSITLYEPTVIGVFRKSTNPYDLTLVAEVKQLAEVVANSSPYVAMESFINFWHGMHRWKSLSLGIQKQLSTYSDIATKDFLNGFEDFYQPRAHPYFRGKVNVLFGADTVPIAKRIASKLVEQLPHASLHEIAELGHMGPITNPEKFNSSVISILGLDFNQNLAGEVQT